MCVCGPATTPLGLAGQIVFELIGSIQECAKRCRPDCPNTDPSYVHALRSPAFARRRKGASVLRRRLLCVFAFYSNELNSDTLAMYRSICSRSCRTMMYDDNNAVAGTEDTY